MLLVLLITAGGVVLASKFWSDYRQSLRSDRRFAISADHVVLTPTPGWIKRDFREQALSGFDWPSYSLLDENLVADVAKHLQQQGWVEQIIRVQKTGGGLAVDLNFRQPIAMVQISNRDLMPIDTQGVVLDSAEFSQEQASQLLRIAIRDLQVPALMIGKPWPDLSVQQAAAIGKQLASSSVETQIAGIYAFELPSEAGINRPIASQIAAGPNNLALSQPADPSLERDKSQTRLANTEFRLWTVQRNEIIWGHASGFESQGEVSASQKMAALEEFIKRNGPIDGLAALKNGGGNVLDLRSGKLLQLPAARAAAVIPILY